MPINTHRNARLTYARRLALAQDVMEGRVTLQQAAAAHGVSLPTARKWLKRYRVAGASGLIDRSSRPSRNPRSLSEDNISRMRALRAEGTSLKVIAAVIGCSISAVSRLCKAPVMQDTVPLEPPFAVPEGIGGTSSGENDV